MASQPTIQAIATANLAQKGREAAIAELKNSIAEKGSTALLVNSPSKSENLQLDDAESISSLPLSVPEEPR